jgi:hypothetical protein
MFRCGFICFDLHSPLKNPSRKGAFSRLLEILMPQGPPIFLAGCIGFLLAVIATILLRY